VLAQDDAAPPDLSEALTLEDCIRIGLARATSVRTAEISVQLGDLQVKDAAAAFLPNVQSQGRYSFDQRVDFGFERENYDLNLSADYLLWDQGRRNIALQQAKQGRQAAQARLERSRQDLILEIVQAYYALLRSQRLLTLNRELLKSSRRNAESVTLRLQLGEAIEADVAAADVRVANDELNIVNEENNLNLARADLPAAMGLDPGTVVTVVDDPEFDTYLNTGRAKEYTRTAEETIALALAQRPEIRESELSLRVLELTRKTARLNRLPRVTARADFAANVDDYLHEGGDFKDFRTWSAAAALSFPIFDGGATRREVDRSELDLLRAREQHDGLLRTIALAARQAYLSLKQAEKRLEISAIQVRNARLSLEVTRERFAQEVASLLELFDAQDQYAQATTAQIRAFYDYKVAQRALERAVGGPIE
jgi:outer membrane protein TolC